MYKDEFSEDAITVKFFNKVSKISDLANAAPIIGAGGPISITGIDGEGKVTPTFKVSPNKTYSVLIEREGHLPFVILNFPVGNAPIDLRTVPFNLLPGDINGDGVVNFQDLVLLFAAWGKTPGNNPGDANPRAKMTSGGGAVNGDDLAILIGSYAKGTTQFKLPNEFLNN